MADPKMLALVDYLRANYHRPGETYQTPEAQVPRMSSEDYRTGEFLRSAPAHLPAPAKASKTQALVSLLMQPTGGRNGLATRMSMIPPNE